MTFSFRLRVVVPPGRGLNVTDETPMPVQIHAGALGSIWLHGEGPSSARDATSLVLTGSGYATEEEAHRVGEATKNALRRAGVVANVPLDLGPDRASAGLGKRIREQLEEEHGVHIRADVHGLDCYEDDGRPVSLFSGSASALTTARIDGFVSALENSFQHAAASKGVKNEKVSLAAELYSLSEFETSHKTRFLALMTALEVLSERGQRPAPIKELLGEWVSLSRKAAMEVGTQKERSAFESLIGSLEELRKESVTSGLRELVSARVGDAETYGEQRVTRFVTDCYKVRSRLTHDGRLPEGVNIARLWGELRRLVRAVLISEFDGS